MALAIGDVITYMALALDNKEPEGQIARSEVYFIEILPLKEIRLNQMRKWRVSKKKFRSDFINKTKKIIRTTYDALLEDDLKKEKLGRSL